MGNELAIFKELCLIEALDKKDLSAIANQDFDAMKWLIVEQMIWFGEDDVDKIKRNKKAILDAWKIQGRGDSIHYPSIDDIVWEVSMHNYDVLYRLAKLDFYFNRADHERMHGPFEDEDEIEEYISVMHDEYFEDWRQCYWEEFEQCVLDILDDEKVSFKISDYSSFWNCISRSVALKVDIVSNDCQNILFDDVHQHQLQFLIDAGELEISNIRNTRIINV